MFQNNETTAMLVFQTNPVGVELFSYVKTFVNLFQKICTGAGHVSKNALYQIALNLVPSASRFPIWRQERGSSLLPPPY